MNNLPGNRYNSLMFTVIFMIFLFGGCSQNALENISGPSIETESGNSFSSLDMKKKKDNPQIDWPVTGSVTIGYNTGLDQYKGGKITFGQNNKSKLTVERNSLIPPPGTPWGEPVTITMVMDYDSVNQEIQVHFEPHGCQFTIPAQLKIDYRFLDIDIPVLYYIDEDENYIEQQPDQIKANKKWLKIYMNHFSRYAVAHS